MGQYIHYTQEEKERANSVNLEQLMLKQGEILLPAGREKRLGSNHSITIRKNYWYDHATETGGLAIDFVKMYYGKTFSEAMAFLLSEEGVIHVEAEDWEKEKQRKEVLKIPAVSPNRRRLYGYLVKHRKIAPEIVNYFVQKNLLYESCERDKKTGKEYHNAIFVGKDPDGKVQHLHKKGLYSGEKNYKGNQQGSRPEYPFQYRGDGKKVYLFEAPVDLFSYLTLHPDGWKQNSYIALMGVSAKPMLQFLKDRPDVETIVFCLDHDTAGSMATKRLMTELETLEKPYTVEIEQPIRKDWNEDLKALSVAEQEWEQDVALSM